MLKNNKIQKAYDISIRSLQSCYSDYGILAGAHHFTDLWARDSLFAVFGALDIGDTETAKTTIDMFLRHEDHEGRVPYLISRSPLSIGKYLHGKASHYIHPKPNFRSHLSGGFVPDGGLMTIIAAAQYYVKTHDTMYLKDRYKQLMRIMKWYITNFDDECISEWFACEWADATLKIGIVLYTNILYWKALKDMSLLAASLHQISDSKRYCCRSARIREIIYRSFWNGKYFIDWIDYKKQDYFASHPNMLAVHFGLVNRNEAHMILDTAGKFCQNHFTLEENYPRYPWYRIPLFHHCIGMGDYHNRGCLWLQPGILFAINLYKVGRKDEAIKFFHTISSKIVEYDGVFEVYEKDGSPVKRSFYQAEQPFAWSAGLYLFAYHILKKLL